MIEATNQQEWLKAANTWLSSTPPKEYFDKGFASFYIPIEEMLDMMDNQFGAAGYEISTKVDSLYIDRNIYHPTEKDENRRPKKIGVETVNTPTATVSVIIFNPFGGRDIVRGGVGGSASSGADSAFPSCYSNAITNALEKFKVFGRGMKKKDAKKGVSNVTIALRDIPSTWSIEAIAAVQQKHAALGADPDFIAACTARAKAIGSLSPEHQVVLVSGTKEEITEVAKAIADNPEGLTLLRAKYKTL